MSNMVNCVQENNTLNLHNRHKIVKTVVLKNNIHTPENLDPVFFESDSEKKQKSDSLEISFCKEESSIEIVDLSVASNHFVPYKLLDEENISRHILSPLGANTDHMKDRKRVCKGRKRIKKTDAASISELISDSVIPKWTAYMKQKTDRRDQNSVKEPRIDTMWK